MGCSVIKKKMGDFYIHYGDCLKLNIIYLSYSEICPDSNWYGEQFEIILGTEKPIIFRYDKGISSKSVREAAEWVNTNVKPLKGKVLQ